MEIPKILLVIEHEPADKGEDGMMATGAVVSVQANLPSRYFDIVVREAEVTERDAEGAAAGWKCDARHPRGETPFDVEFDPSPFQEGEDEAPPERDDGIEEWEVMFWHGDEVQTALVLKAPDVIAAAQRVMQEFPFCRIVRIAESWPDEHPMTYLDENKIILPVGGPRVPMWRVREQ